MQQPQTYNRKRSPTLVIHTGNVASQGLCNQGFSSESTAVEILKSLGCTMTAWKKSNPDKTFSGVIDNPVLVSKVSEQAIRASDITVKLFLIDSDGNVESILRHVLNDLGVAKVNTVVVATPLPNKSELSEFFLKSWEAMESLVKLGLTNQIATSDLSVAQLDLLLRRCTVAPSANQIGYKYMTDDARTELLKFANEKGIRLSTHDDTGDVLPATQFSDALSGQFPDLTHFKPSWGARYSVMNTDRSVITQFGYIIGARRTAIEMII